MRGAALLMIFIDHSSGNVFSRLTLRHLQFCDAAEIFFLLSGYSCMAAYGRRFDQRDFKSTAAAIGRRCLTLYLVQILTLLAAEALVWSWGHSEPLDFAALHPLAGVQDSTLGVAGSELFRVNSWREVMHMALLTGEPAYFDILRPYIVLLAVFPLIWLGLRRAPVCTIIASTALWAATHGDHGLSIDDPVQGLPWAFNPFAWQLIFVCGATLRILLEQRRHLPRAPLLTAAALCIVAAGLAFNLAYALGFEPPRPLLGRANLSPIRLLNSLALVYLVMSRDWRPARPWPFAAALSLCGRHSLLIFATGLLLSVATDLAFIDFGQALPVQIAATAGGALLLVAIAAAAEQRRRPPRPALAAE